MSHEIDMTTGQPAIAYVGETPWHGLGTELKADASIQEWQEAAGLNWNVMPIDVEYRFGTKMHKFDARKVLVRDDTAAPLSAVSDGYKIVQPSDVLGFFEDLVDRAGFHLQTAGSLHNGRVIWAQAEVGGTVDIQDDKIQPRLLLSTSYDTSVPTIAKFVATRVVCANTIAMAMTEKSKRMISVKHSAVFNPDAIKEALDIGLSSFDKFITQAHKLANLQMPETAMDHYLQELLAPQLFVRAAGDQPLSVAEIDAIKDQVRKSRTYKKIMDLFHGEQIGGSQEAVKGTAWGALNAVTQFIDHEKGRNQSSRLMDAWFGMGGQFKERAFELLAA